jgi:hypothetical protein
MRVFINGRIDYEFNVTYANHNYQFPPEGDMWPELARSSVRDMLIRCSAEIERQQLYTVSKSTLHLSIDFGTIRHVQTLNFFAIGEGPHVS